MVDNTVPRSGNSHNLILLVAREAAGGTEGVEVVVVLAAAAAVAEEEEVIMVPPIGDFREEVGGFEAMVVEDNFTPSRILTTDHLQFPVRVDRCHGMARRARYRVPQVLPCTPFHYHHRPLIIRQQLRCQLFSTFRVRFTPL